MNAWALSWNRYQLGCQCLSDYHSGTRILEDSERPESFAKEELTPLNCHEKTERGQNVSQTDQKCVNAVPDGQNIVELLLIGTGIQKVFERSVYGQSEDPKKVTGGTKGLHVTPMSPESWKSASNQNMSQSGPTGIIGFQKVKTAY